LMIRARFFLANDAEDDVARLFAGRGPMHFGATRFEFVREFGEIFIEMIERFPISSLPPPVARPDNPEKLARFVPHHFIFLQRRLDDIAMPQVVRQHFRLLSKLL